MYFNLEQIKKDKLSLTQKSLVGKTKNLPSKDRRHIKNQLKVDFAIEDLYQNHNHSWYQELLMRNRDNMDKPALFYRGNVISYQEMFFKADKLISALGNFGLKKGDEVPMCVSNTPEMIYLLLACSALGLKPNIFGVDFDDEYIREIVKNSNNKIIFISDDNYLKKQTLFNEIDVSKKVIYSVYDSVEYEFMMRYLNEYIWESPMGYANIHSKGPDCIYLKDFIYQYNNGEVVLPNVSLEDDFTVTYTSGSTKNGRPKALIHRVKSFNAMGRFHDPDLSGTPSMSNLRSLAHIPPHSNTCLITSISDMLFQGGCVALEPVYDKEYFLDSLILNKPTLVPATRSFWLHAMKSYLSNPMYRDLKFPQLLCPIAVGEPVSRNEEKFINDCFKKLKMGTKVVPFPISPVTLSIGGGDCEHGGLFFTLFKNLRERLSLSKEECGLKPFALANVKVLNEGLEECGYNELGMLVGNSLCTMREYKNNPEATKEFFIQDQDDEVNGNFKVWSYIDKKGNVHMKGRMENEFILEEGIKIPLFMIADEILRDSKKIMSCEVVNIDNQLIAYLEFFPGINVYREEEKRIFLNILKRLNKTFTNKVSDNIHFIVKESYHSYPLTGCGKRNIKALEDYGRDFLADSKVKKLKKVIEK